MFFFFKQKTAYEMRISDWSSDVCSSDLLAPAMIALRQWGEKWGCGPASCQVLADGRDRQPIRKMTIQAHDGRVLEPGDLIWLCVDEETPVRQEAAVA